MDRSTDAVAAVAAGTRGSTDRPAFGQRGRRGREGSSIDIADTASQRVAAVPSGASGTADGLVIGEHTVTECGRGLAVRIVQRPAASGARHRNARVKGGAVLLVPPMLRLSRSVRLPAIKVAGLELVIPP